MKKRASKRVASLRAARSAASSDPAAIEKVLRYSDGVSFCEQFGGILEPDAPVDEVLVGTFDALTAEFTWAPGTLLLNRPPPYVPPWAQPAPWLGELISIAGLLNEIGIAGIQPYFPSSVLMQSPQFPNPGALSSARAGTGERLSRPAPEDRRFPFPGPKGSPPKGKAPPDKAYYVRAQGGQLRLRFRVVNRPPNVPFDVQVFIPWQLGNRTTETSNLAGTPGDEYIFVLIPPVGYVNFHVSVGPNEFEDLVGFLRPPILGCFTLDAIPVSYVYEPPGSNSSQSYTVANQVSTTKKSFTANESSQTTPNWVPFFTGLQKFADALGAISGPVALAYPTASQVMKGAGNALTGLLGSVGESTTVTHRVTEENVLLFQETSADQLTTSLHLGPGRGDMIHILINPLFAWLAAEDEVTGRVFLSVALLSYEVDGHASAEDLRNGTWPFNDQIPADTRRALLEADPLTAESQTVHTPSPDGNPAPDRFVSAGPDIAHAGGVWTFTLQQSLQQSYTRTEEIIKTQTRVEESGFLGFISSSLPATGTTTLTTLEGSATGYSTQSTATNVVTLDTALGEGLLLRPYFDTLYGTFALVPLPMTGPAITGLVTTRRGLPAAGRDVLLIAGLRRIQTRTDRAGRFQITAEGLGSGRCVALVGRTRQEFEFQQAPITVNVQLP